MFCSSCGKENEADARFCIHCSEELQNAASDVKPIPLKVVCNDAGLDLVLPPNKYAIWAYYLGVASILCGPPVGIPALTCGIMALESDREHPNRSSRFHAWIGIVFSVLSMLFTMLFILISIILD